MQITLNQDEIVAAIEAYVRTQITVQPTQRIEVDLKAGRGENGYSATLEIRPNTAGGIASMATPSKTTRDIADTIQPEVLSRTAVTSETPSKISGKAAHTVITDGKSLFGAKVPKNEKPAPEPETVLPQQDPANEARMPADEGTLVEPIEEQAMTAEDADRLAEETVAANEAATTSASEAAKPSSIFKFAKG